MWLALGFCFLGLAAVLLVLKIQIPSSVTATNCERGLLLPRYVSRPVYDFGGDESKPAPEQVVSVKESQPAWHDDREVVIGEARAQRLLSETTTSTHRRALGTFL